LACPGLFQYWLNLQARHDLKTAKASLGKLMNNVHLLAHA
jgi:plasmid maintenance system antidote protein VapI